MWNGRRRGLEREPGDDHRHPGDEQRVVRARRVPDRVEAELAGGAVGERGAEQQDRRAEAADDQVLEPGLERLLAVRVERDEDVERDREPLEPEEERHQVPGRDEERHPAAGGREERVVLADVVAAAVAPRDEHGGEPEAGDEHLGERGEPVAAHRLGDQERLLRASGRRRPPRARRRRRSRRPRSTTEKTRRPPAGTSTAPSRQIAAAASSASEGESASQSTFGVAIEAATITVSPTRRRRAPSPGTCAR